jgi:DUF4097 and DUF4098 domain-containing protein YvlB
MRRAYLLVFLAVFLTGCSATLASPGRARDTISEEFAVGEAPTLEVENFAGNIEIHAGGNETIRVVATRRADRSTDLEQIGVDMDGTSNDVVIKTERPARLSGVAVDLNVTVPPYTEVRAHTGGGNVELNNVSGPVEVRSGGGNLTVAGTSGEVDVETGGGEVIVRTTQGPVRVHTGGGNVEIDGATESVTVETGGGDVEVRASGDVSVRTGGGNITIRDGAGALDAVTGGGNISYEGMIRGDARLQSGGGNISVRLPATAQLSLDLEVPSTCRDCRIDVDFTVEGTIAQREVRGTIGDGRDGQLRASTGGGDITVQGR